jgi:hypothetical protein
MTDTAPSAEALEFAHSCRWPDSRVDLSRLVDEFRENERQRMRAAIFAIRDKDGRSLDWCNALNEAMDWTRGGQP